MKKTVIKSEAPRFKRRAVELFSSEFNFKMKTVESNRAYKRREKHRNREA